MLEAAGKTGPDDERMLWQGLAQLMVGITHVRRGNVEGAIALLRRASARPAHYELAAPYAIDVAGLVDTPPRPSWCFRWLSLSPPSCR